MTVSSQTSRVDYAGDGVTAIFPVPFYFLENTHLQVILSDDVTGAETVLVLNTDYTVTGAGVLAGGSITVPSEPAVGFTLTILRSVPITQETDYVPNDPFPAESHERALDKLTMIIQQQSTDSAGAIKVAVSDPEPSRLPPAASRALKLAGFDNLGNPIAVVATADSAAALALDLLNDTDPAKGAGLVGYSGTTVAATLDSHTTDITTLTTYSGWQFDPDLVANTETDHVKPVVGGGAFIDVRYDLAQSLNFQRMPTRYTRHVGLSSSAVEMPDTSFLLITRQALAHAEDAATGKIVQYRTQYGSKVIQNEETSTILDTGAVDDRDMSIGYMASGRLGMVSGKPFSNLKPVFSYTDDNGLNWSSAEITTAPLGWTSWFGIHPYPASAGGSDSGGYICYGNIQFGAATEISALYTLDNGATWTHVAIFTGIGAENPSEITVARVGDDDLWLMAYRQNATTTGAVRFSFSTNMTTWSTPVDGGLTLGKNPPYLFWHEGFMYFFAAFRDSAFFGDLTPDAKYANKLSYARTTAQMLVAQDLTDFDALDPVASFGSMNGYFTLNKSPLTGKVFGAINYDEKADGLITGLSQRSSLALVTDEKLVSPSDGLRGTSIYTDGVPISWRVTRDQPSGNLRAAAITITLTSDGTGNRLFKSVVFPVTFQTAQLETSCLLKGLTAGGSAINRLGLGQLIVENITTTGCDISLYRVSAAPSFVSDSTAPVSLTIEGNYVRNDY